MDFFIVGWSLPLCLKSRTSDGDVAVALTYQLAKGLLPSDAFSTLAIVEMDHHVRPFDLRIVRTSCCQNSLHRFQSAILDNGHPPQTGLEHQRSAGLAVSPLLIAARIDREGLITGVTQRDAQHQPTETMPFLSKRASNTVRFTTHRPIHPPLSSSAGLRLSRRSSSSTHSCRYCCSRHHSHPVQSCPRSLSYRAQLVLMRKKQLMHPGLQRIW